MTFTNLDFETRTARRNQLSAVDILGSFDFPTAVIHLKSLNAADIGQAQKLLAGFTPDWNEGNPRLLSGDQFLALAKVLPLAVHEYTHFIDATSTLWGLRHLQQMSGAYTSINDGESGYHKAKSFFDHIRSIRLPSYYTVVQKQSHSKRPWRSTVTIGRIFDTKGGISERPVLFSRFQNSDGEIIVRSPISTVSILEASAMAQEIMSHTNLLKITDSEFRLVEERDFAKKHIDFLYSRDLTEYSVCIHILANRLNCSDSLVAFRMCARLTRIALNFPAVLFDKLSESCPVEAMLDIPLNHEFGQAIRYGLRAHDLGTIYYLLCNTLPLNVIESEEHFTNGIDAAIRSLGIGVEELMEAAEIEAQSLTASVCTTPIEYIKMLALAGHENFKRIQLTRAELIFTELNVPPSLLGDDTVTHLFSGDKNSLKKFDLEGCFFELDDGMSWVNRFSEACL